MSAPKTPRAFPSNAIDDRFGGMTLRDWFAGQAMSALLSRDEMRGYFRRDGSGTTWEAQLACAAGRIADEMLSERGDA